MKRFIIIISIIMLSAIMVSAAGSTDIKLAWDANTEADLVGYYVKYSLTNTKPFPNSVKVLKTALSNPAAPIYTLKDLPNKRYYIAVTAFNSAGKESGYSNVVTAPPLAPKAPTGCRVLDRIR